MTYSMRTHVQPHINQELPLVVGVHEQRMLGETACLEHHAELSSVLGALSIAPNQHVDIRLASGGRVIFWSTTPNASPQDVRKQGGKFFSLCQTLSYPALQVLPWTPHIDQLIYGINVRDWRFDTYRTSASPMPTLTCSEITIITQDSALSCYAKEIHGRISSLHWARQRCNEPGNVLTPTQFAQHLKQFSDLNIDVEIIEHAELEQKGFGALIGVGQGSVYPPCLAVLQWKGGAADDAFLTFVGKGVTFDTGGISIKPSSKMSEMKMDMSGAAVAAALIRAAAIDHLPLNISVVIPLAENAVSAQAQRPGDIVTSLSGQTIEVLDTDAEGRLILADALWYAQERFSPEVLVDVATLTGAVRVALGPEYAGLFGSCESLVQDIKACGTEEGEGFWHLPLDAAFNRALDSDCADMKNIANAGYGAGSSIGAQFLKRFVKAEQRWAHLDIANVDHLTSDHPLCPKGGCAFGFQTLYRYLKSRAEGKLIA
jgi:leucyl aminopeptidase